MDDNLRLGLISSKYGDIALLLLLKLPFLFQLVCVAASYGNTSTFHLAETVVNRDLGQLGIIKLHASDNGMLWIATQESISRYDWEFHFFLFEDQNRKWLNTKHRCDKNI